MPDIDRLWAPWRSGFVSVRRPRRCIFCTASASRKDRQHHVVARSRHVFCLLNRYPYNNGHLILAPYRHVGRFEALRSEEWLDLFGLSEQLMRRLRRGLHPDGFNLGINLGKTAGAGVPGHLHLHIVPRWTGDTNFMPILGKTKVIPQSLDALYALLTPSRR